MRRNTKLSYLSKTTKSKCIFNVLRDIPLFCVFAHLHINCLAKMTQGAFSMNGKERGHPAGWTTQYSSLPLTITLSGPSITTHGTPHQSEPCHCHCHCQEEFDCIKKNLTRRILCCAFCAVLFVLCCAVLCLNLCCLL